MPIWKTNPYAVATAASVDIVTSNNVTWEDAIQFDGPGVTGQPPPPYWPGGSSGPTWTFVGQAFRCDIKGYIDGPTALLSIDQGKPNCQAIQIQDPINRILNFNVPAETLNGVTMVTGCTGVGLVPGEYIYDFVMYDASNPSIRVMLMQGKFVYNAGITGGY